jgi:hypothetical protein
MVDFNVNATRDSVSRSDIMEIYDLTIRAITSVVASAITIGSTASFNSMFVFTSLLVSTRRPPCLRAVFS